MSNLNALTVTASVVTYNSSDEINTVLESLTKYIEEQNIYVIDNNSKDGTIEAVAKYRSVKLIRNEKNLGFGAAHNQAINRVSSRYHIIVNPDIKVNGETIEALTIFMEANKDVVCCTPRILNPDGTEQYLPRKLPNFKYLISGALEEKVALGKKWRDEYTRKNETFLSPTDIEICTGCFMFIRTDVLKKIGGFDERYFLHFEDIDLSRKLSAYGRIVFYPMVSITHKWHRDNLNDKHIRIIAKKSMIKYFLKWGLR